MTVTSAGSSDNHVDTEITDAVTMPARDNRRPVTLGATLRSLVDRLPALDLPTSLFVAVLVWYVVYFTGISLEVHHGLGSSTYDFGLYDQGVWLLSRFKAPFVTQMGRNLFADHASYILLFVAPLYWLFPVAGTLFFLQSVMVAAGAIPVYALARKRLNSGIAALALGCAYLFHPAVGLTNREAFHPDAFAAFFVGIAIYGAIERKWRLYAIGFALTLLVKEDVGLVLAPLAVWTYLRRDRRIAVVSLLAAVGAAFVGTYVVMRSLIGVPTRNGWRIPFGGPVGLIRQTIHHPGSVWDYLRSDKRPFYLWQMLSPFGFVLFAQPEIAAVSAVVLASNILSVFVYQYRIDYHYSLIAIPGLAMGTVYALSTMTARRCRQGVALVFICALWSGHLWGVLPFSRAHGGYWAPSAPPVVAYREISKGLPRDAAISANNAVTAQLDHRAQIYMFPNPFRVVLYGPDLKLEQARARLPIADRIEYVILPIARSPETQADWALVRPGFTLAKSNQYWELWRKIGPPGTPLPPVPVTQPSAQTVPQSTVTTSTQVPPTTATVPAATVPAAAVPAATAPSAAARPDAASAVTTTIASSR